MIHDVPPVPRREHLEAATLPPANVICHHGSGSFHGYLYGVEFASNTYGDNGNDCNTADDESWRFSVDQLIVLLLLLSSLSSCV